jgi:hypothetical protein
MYTKNQKNNHTNAPWDIDHSVKFTWILLQGCTFNSYRVTCSQHRTVLIDTQFDVQKSLASTHPIHWWVIGCRHSLLQIYETFTNLISSQTYPLLQWLEVILPQTRLRYASFCNQCFNKHIEYSVQSLKIFWSCEWTEHKWIVPESSISLLHHIVIEVINIAVEKLCTSRCLLRNNKK